MGVFGGLWWLVGVMGVVGVIVVLLTFLFNSHFGEWWHVDECVVVLSVSFYIPSSPK